MHRIYIQYACGKRQLPQAAMIRKWALAVLQQQSSFLEVTIRIVGIEEMTTLNTTYRRKQGPTNVLSFPYDAPVDMSVPTGVLGDIVVCASVVKQEAEQQGKALSAHWAHMIVHGMYHLLGYDHETDKDAEKMEALEIKTLSQLGFDNPYLTDRPSS